MHVTQSCRGFENLDNKNNNNNNNIDDDKNNNDDDDDDVDNRTFLHQLVLNNFCWYMYGDFS